MLSDLKPSWCLEIMWFGNLSKVIVVLYNFFTLIFFGVVCPNWLPLFFVSFFAMKWSMFPPSFWVKLGFEPTSKDRGSDHVSSTFISRPGSFHYIDNFLSCLMFSEFIYTVFIYSAETWTTYGSHFIKELNLVNFIFIKLSVKSCHLEFYLKCLVM